MDKNEYEETIKTMKKIHEKELRQVDIAYAESNSPVKEGDLVKDHKETIKVETFQLCRGSSYGLPSLIYHGPLYTKKKVPYASGAYSEVYQSNMKKINGEPYVRD